MDAPHVAKLLSLYSRGVIPTPELANGLLVDLIRDDNSDTELTSFVAGFPNKIQQKLRDLLPEIQKADDHWKHFMLGPGGCVSHSEADDSARLRRLMTARMAAWASGGTVFQRDSGIEG